MIPTKSPYASRGHGMKAFRIFFLICMCVIVGACQSGQDKKSAAQPKRPAHLAKPAPLQDFDACAGRLHDLGGLFLMYYAVHGELPPTLDAALAAADPLTRPEASCPVSKHPYIYSPKGYSAPGDSRKLILYDADPSHNGMHRALLIDPPTPGHALKTWVVQLPPIALQQYLLSSTH